MKLDFKRYWGKKSKSTVFNSELDFILKCPAAVDYILVFNVSPVILRWVVLEKKSCFISMMNGRMGRIYFHTAFVNVRLGILNLKYSKS